MSSADSETQADTESSTEPVDELRQGLLATLQEELGDALVGSEIRAGDIWVRVRADAWAKAARVCRTRLKCDYFCFLSGLDWMPAPKTAAESGGGEVDVSGDDDEDAATEEAAAEPEAGPEPEPEPVAATDGGYVTGYAGGDTRFQVFARLYSTTGNYGITLKADLDEASPSVETISKVYAGANWHERETWEMYGFRFEGHPDLRHIYLPSEFEGHPLRKDYPLLSREVKPWPGLVDVEALPAEGEPAVEPTEEAPPEETSGGGGDT